MAEERNETKKKPKRMAKEEIEKKKKTIMKTFFILVAVIVVGVIAFIANDYIIFDQNKKINLVINNRNITSDLKNDILIQDDVIYLSKADIANFFDQYIYYEKETNQMITTYDKKIAAINFEENKITINGSEKNIYAHAMKKEEIEYLPISEMKDVYDIEIQNTTVTLASLRLEEKENFKPDIVITVGGNYIFNNELKNYLRPSHVQHWQVGKEDRVCDPFHHLVNIFEMPEELFFSCLNESADFENEGEYAKNWLAIAALPEMPTPDYNELYAVGALLKSLPKNVDLQLANSCTIRMAHFFHIDPSVTVHCNRGVNGIDGSMSTAVGFSAFFLYFSCFSIC